MLPLLSGKRGLSLTEGRCGGVQKASASRDALSQVLKNRCYGTDAARRARSALLQCNQASSSYGFQAEALAPCHAS